MNGDTCYLKYRTHGSKDGTRVHQTIRLCEKSDKFTWWKKNGKLKFGSAVKNLQEVKMQGIKLQATEDERAVKSDTTAAMTVAEYWEHRYLPYCEEVVKLTGEPRMKPSTRAAIRRSGSIISSLTSAQ